MCSWPYIIHIVSKVDRRFLCYLYDFVCHLSVLCGLSGFKVRNLFVSHERPLVSNGCRAFQWLGLFVENNDLLDKSSFIGSSHVSLFAA